MPVKTLVDISNTSRDSSTSGIKTKRWTGVIQASPGPSRLSPSLPGNYTFDESRDEDEIFSERFKYLICSSGVLEKDWVPGLSEGRGSSGDADDDTEEGDSGIRDEDTEQAPPASMPFEYYFKWDKRRWDVALAGVVLVGAMGTVLGPAKLLAAAAAIIAILAICAAVFARYPFAVSSPISLSNGPDSVLQHASSRNPKPVSLRPLSQSRPHSAALHSLTSLFTHSQRLDAKIGSSLALLQSHESGSFPNQTLRIALHRLTDDMTDHLACATSRLLELVDRDELAVLGEMYDIPVSGTFLYARKTRGSESDDDEPDARANVPSPGRSIGPALDYPLSGAIPTDHADSTPVASSLAMSASQFLPNRFRPSHRTHHLSLISASLPTPRHALHLSAEDHFTAIPSRIPRLSKRSSWDGEFWSAVRHEGVRRPPHERRITEADEEGPAKESASSEQTLSDLEEHAARSYMPTSPGLRAPQTYTPTRTSPLSRRLEMTPDRPMVPVLSTGDDLLPSPFSLETLRSSTLSPNPKRSSLQNMPYYHSSNDVTVSPSRASTSIVLGAELTRTRSLPISELQELRSRSATGSRRSSTISPQRIISPTPPAPARRSRVPSVSPLTIPGLKAACLGLHLKRRRMACCLLGLRFGANNPDGYWEEVTAILDELRDVVVEERDRLEGLKREAEREMATAAHLDNEFTSAADPPWSTTLSGRADFAPRTGDQEIVLRLVEALQSTVTKACADLAAVRSSLIIGEEDMRGPWAVIREDLGIMVREWERGKDVVARLAVTTDPKPLAVEDGVEQEDGIPEFLKAWDDEEESANETLLDIKPLPMESEMDDSDIYDQYPEVLPPPGVDEVFEASSLPLRSERSALSALSRDERIRLTKEARAKGMTLGDMMDKENGTGGVDVEKQLKVNGGEVVSELQGMIGMIRRMKGHAEEPSVGLSRDIFGADDHTL